MPPEIQLEKEIDRLYGLARDEFVPARRALVQKLRKQGERAAAMRVQDLRKPTAAAAVVNRLVRDERMNVRALVAAGERLHEAQASLLQNGNPDAVREAAEDERRAISALVAAARKEGVNEAVLRRVESTLHAAAIDDEGRAELVEGRLTREREAAGFGLEGMPMPKPRPKKKQKSPPRDGDAERRRRALERARADVEAAERRSADAAEDVKRAQEQLEELERSNKRR